VSALVARLRSAAWLGWQLESNWADPFLFIVYSLVRPLATSLILAAMFWAVRGRGADASAFLAFYVGNAFHFYVVQVMIGMGWAVVEEREDYETLKYVFASPIGMFVYLAGRASVKLVLATVSLLLMLAVGWFVVGLRWDWGHVAWLPFLAAWALGLVATLFLGFLVAGMAMLLPRAAMNINEGISIALYLLCGVIFPIDLLPRALQWLALVLPFTWWYEALRRFLLGRGASVRLSHVPDATLLAALLVSTLVFSLASRWGYTRLEHRARQLGRLDQTTLF
jgi:ABC-2 type transport system permease protein